MTLDEIYNDIFPLGSIDDNNNYINKTAEDLNPTQLLEPTLGVSEFIVTAKDRVVRSNLPDRMSFRLPYLSINDYIVRNEIVNYFCLDYSSFVPTVTVEFIDMDNEMLSTNSIRDGSIIKVYIGGNGDELYYKPIRQDFVITNILKLNSGNQNEGDWIQYRLSGSLNVPMGHRKESWTNNPCTSMQELFNLAIYTGLGFQVNFTFDTIDKMQWTNTLGSSYFDLMRDIAAHACYSPNTFFTAFIDQYYVLNFLECHSLLSHGGSKTDTPAMIYPNFQDESEPSKDKSKNEGKNKETTDQITVNKNKGESDLMNKNQKLSCYFLTNHHYYYGWSNFIESYNEISQGFSSMSDGYRKHVSYSDSNSCGWGSNGEFIISPIDNLERDSATQQIKSLPGKPSQNSYIPLNLMQMNNPEYAKDGIKDVDKMSNVESFVNYGEVDTSNMYKQYYFAEVQNEYQMTCMKKCGLKVTLQNFNPSVKKFTRIWVDLFDMNATSSQSLKPDKSGLKNLKSDSPLYKYKEWLNNEIIQYDDEGVMNTSDDENKKNTNFPMGNYNRSLSGWYVITEMKFEFDNYEKNIKTHLVLNRIEHKPIYKSEYNLAKQAVDKYKEENKPECIYRNTDDYSY